MTSVLQSFVGGIRKIFDSRNDDLSSCLSDSDNDFKSTDNPESGVESDEEPLSKKFGSKSVRIKSRLLRNTFYNNNNICPSVRKSSLNKCNTSGKTDEAVNADEHSESESGGDLKNERLERNMKTRSLKKTQRENDAYPLDADEFSESKSNIESIGEFSIKDCKVKLKKISGQWNNQFGHQEDRDNEHKTSDISEMAVLEVPLSQKKKPRKFSDGDFLQRMKACSIRIQRCDEILQFDKKLTTKLTKNTLKTLSHNMIKTYPTHVICAECKKTFRLKKHLIRHLSVHGRFKPFECPLCHRAFYRKVILIHHIKSLHFDHFCCSNVYCKKIYWNEKSLKEHKKTCHTGKLPFPCGKCRQSFVSRRGLNRHMSLLHAVKELYYCSTCGREFKSKIILKEHVEKHLKCLKDPTIICFHCGCRFRYKHEVQVHIKNRHMNQERGNINLDQ